MTNTLKNRFIASVYLKRYSLNVGLSNYPIIFYMYILSKKVEQAIPCQKHPAPPLMLLA